MRKIIAVTLSAVLATSPAFAQFSGGGGGSGGGFTPGTNISSGAVTGTTMGTVAPVARTTAQRSADVFNVRDYGALGTNSQATVGTTGCFASFAAFSGSGCYPWATNSSYGLTFSVTILPQTTTSPAGQNVVNFLEPAGYYAGSPPVLQPGAVWYANSLANTAAWQYEASSNAPVPGMVVSNGPGTTCIPANATVVGVGADPSGTFSTSGVSYGTITISGNLNSGGCVAGNVINFTISTSQLQSLTQDWLGIQNAVANAESQTSPGVTNTSTVISQNTGSGGAKIFFPPGIYYINHPILYSATSGNEDYPSPSVFFEGDNWVTSAIQVPGSAPMMGFDSCVIQPSAWNSSSQINFTNLRLVGTASTSAVGSFPNAYKGLCLSTGSMASNVSADVFYAGLVIRESHDKVEKSHFEHNGYGIYFTPYTNSNGNISVKESYIVSNFIAAVGIAATNQIDASDFENIHFYGNPFGFYREAKPSNVTAVDAYFLTNSNMTSLYNEQGGNAFIYSDPSNSSGGYADSSIIGNIFTGGYWLNYGGYSNPTNCTTAAASHNYAWWSAKPSPAPILVANFQNNTMIDTYWGFAYNYPCSFSGAQSSIVDAQNSAYGNMWINDPTFITGGTASFPALFSLTPLTGIFSNTNRFEYGSQSGEIYASQPGATFAAGTPISQGLSGDNYHLEIVNYLPGTNFLGVSAVTGGNSSTIAYVPVIEKGININMLTTSTSGAIATNQLLYPSTGGFAPTFSTPSGVAMAFYPSAGNGALVQANLDRSLGTSSPLTSLGQTATGSGGSGQFPIAADFTEFTGGAGAQFILNNNLPPGRSEKVCNDTSGSLTGYPPAGATFGASGPTVTLLTNSCATYTKMSVTKWSIN